MSQVLRRDDGSPGGESHPGPAAQAPGWKRQAGVACALAGLLCVVLFCALRPIYDIDEWWHIVVGRWILEHHRLPTEDVFSAADPHAPWLSFQWLWQIGAAWIDRRFGLECLRLCAAGFITASFAGIYVLLRRGGERRATAFLLCALLLIAFHDRIRVRPHIIGLLVWFVVGLSLHRLRTPATGAGLVRAGIALALGFTTWAALHNGDAFLALTGLVGIAVEIGLWGLLLANRTGPRQTDRGALLLVLCAVCGWVLCPGSVRTFSYMGSQHGATIASIGEWASWGHTVRNFREVASPNMFAALLLAPCAALLWLRAVVDLWRSRDTLRDDDVAARPHELIFAAQCTLMAFLWHRYTFLAVLAIALCRRFLLRQRPAQAAAPPAHRLQPALIAAGAVLALCISLHYATVAQFSSVGAAIRARRDTIDASHFPVSVTDLLIEAGIEGRVAVPGGWGGYVLYYGFPRLRVTLDGRMVAPDDVRLATELIAQIFTTSVGREHLPALYSSLPADFLIMPHPAFLGAKETGEWLRLAETPEADLYVRRGPRMRGWLLQLQAAASRHRAH